MRTSLGIKWLRKFFVHSGMDQISPKGSSDMNNCYITKSILFLSYAYMPIVS